MQVFSKESGRAKDIGSYLVRVYEKELAASKRKKISASGIGECLNCPDRAKSVLPLTLTRYNFRRCFVPVPIGSNARSNAHAA